MAFNLTIDSSPRKYEEIGEAVRHIYSHHPDPAGLEASHIVSNIISAALPGVDKQKLMKDAPYIIEAYTGYQLDSQGAVQEFVKTGLSQWEDLTVSMKYTGAMLSMGVNGADSEAFKSKLASAFEAGENKKLTYRTDFKDMSPITDLAISSGKLLPSQLPSLVMYALAGLAAPVTGGASFGLARAGSSINGALMEAGSIAKELYSVEDENGNRLSHEDIFKAWAVVAGGVGVLNLITNRFEAEAGKAFQAITEKLISKETVKGVLKSGAAKSFAQYLLKEKTLNTASEAFEESMEEFIGMFVSDYLKKHNNETEGTLFKTFSKDEYIEAMKQAAIDTAKGMVLTGIPSEVVSAYREYSNSDSPMKKNANKFSPYNDESYVVSIDEIDMADTIAPEEDFKKFEEPVKVLKVGERFIPVDKADVPRIRAVETLGASALNVTIANGNVDQATADIPISTKQARNVAARTENALYKDNTVVLDTKEKMEAAANQFATETNNVVDIVNEPDGSIIVSKDNDGTISSVRFATKETVPDAVVPKGQGKVNPMIDEDEELTAVPDNGVVSDVRKVVSKDYDNYKTSLAEKGATEADIKYLDNSILRPMIDMLKKVFPNKSAQEIYRTAMPSTYFAYLAARVAGQSPKQFFSKGFTAEKFIEITEKMERDFFESSQGQQSLDLETMLQGLDNKQKMNLAGLRIKSGNRTTIALGKASKPWTVVHELSHALVDAIKDTDAFAPFKSLYAAELESDGGVVGLNVHEKFASDLELYIKEGKLRDEAMRSVFDRIIDAIKAFGKYLNGSLNAETRKAFDDLFDLKLQDEIRNSKLEQIEADTNTIKTPAKVVQKQLELNLMSDSDSIIDSLANIERSSFAIKGGKNEFLKQMDRVKNFDADQKLSRVESGDFYTLYPYQDYFFQLDMPMVEKVRSDGIVVRLSIISHSMKRHEKEGLTVDLIKDAISQADNPIAVIASERGIDPETGKPRKGILLLVSETLPEDSVRKTPRYMVIAVENDVVSSKYIKNADGETEAVDIIGTIAKSVYFWRDELQAGFSIKRLPVSRRMLAIDKKRWSTSGPATDLEGGERVLSPSGKNIIWIPSKVNDDVKASFETTDTNTPEFKAWFGDSEFVNADGTPRVAYHGTKGHVREFKSQYEDQLIFFSTNPQFASDWGYNKSQPEKVSIYDEPLPEWKQVEDEARDLSDAWWKLVYTEDKRKADHNHELFNKLEKQSKEVMMERYGVSSWTFIEKLLNTNVVPVFLSAKKIFNPEQDYEIAVNLIREGKIFEGDASEETINSLARHAKNGDWLIYENANMVKELKKLGYDALWLRENSDGPFETVAIFSPNQAKSVFNNGEWSTDNNDILASFESDNIIQTLSKGGYPTDGELNQAAGHPDVDWEIQFRKVWNQDKPLADVAMDAFDHLMEEQTQGKVKPEDMETRFLEILDSLVAEEDKFDLKKETGDPKRFARRVIQQMQYQPREKIEKELRKELADTNALVEFAKRVIRGVDIADDTEISDEVFQLANTPNPGVSLIRKARADIRKNLTTYRNIIMKHDGEIGQLSFERATIEQEYFEGGERFTNSEVKKLLVGSTDPVIKSLVRKNLATGKMLQSIIDSMNKKIADIAQEMGLKDLSIEALMKMIEEGEEEYVKRNKAYMELQETNRRHRENYRNMKKALELRTAALEAKIAMERMVRQGDRIAKQTPNHDARIMKPLQEFWKVMKSDVGRKTDLSNYFEKQGIKFDEFPAELKEFFEQTDSGVFFRTKLSDMTIGQLEFMRDVMRNVKNEARNAVNDRFREQTNRIAETVMKYDSARLNVKGSNITETLYNFDKLKASTGYRGTTESGKNAQKNVGKAYLETQFLTFSRLIKKIDPSGVLYHYFFERNGGVDKIVAIETEQKLKRLKAGQKKLAELKIKETELVSEFMTLKKNGKKHSITVDEAIGFYLYSKMPAAMNKLTSINGNKFSKEEVAMVLLELDKAKNAKYKAWANFMAKDMQGRFQPLADVFYRTTNMTMGYVSNYFPLVSDGKVDSMVDMMKEEVKIMQEHANRDMTYERTDSTYALDLHATRTWFKMVQKQEHYIASAEWINDTQHMLLASGGDLYNAIELSKGKMYADAVQQFVNRFARQSSVQDTTDAIINHVRKNLVVARLAFNFITALKQIPSLMYFTTQFGPVRLMQSIGQVLLNPKETMAMIYKYAPVLENRSAMYDMDFANSMIGRNKYEIGIDKMGKAGMSLIKMFDKMVVNTLWLGSFNANLEKGMGEEAAARAATRFIGDTQPGGSVVDSAAIYTTNNQLVKFALMFTSQLNKNFNMLYADMPMAFRQKQFKKGLAHLAGLGLSFAGIILMDGSLFADDDDDEDKFWKLMGGQVLNQLPIIGGFANALATDSYYGSGDALVLPEFANFIKAWESGDAERKMDRLADFALSLGELKGLPTGISAKAYNVYEEYRDEGDLNLGYMLNSKWAEYFSE